MHVFSCDYCHSVVEGFTIICDTTLTTRGAPKSTTFLIIGKNKNSLVGLYRHSSSIVATTWRYLSTSQTDNPNFLPKPKPPKKKNQKSKTTVKQKQEGLPPRRLKPKKEKKTVNDLVSSMGLLTPAPNKLKIKQEKKKQISTTTQRRVPSLAAQLDYARNGHTVLREYITPSKITPIREELLAFGTKHQLQAWQQKVAVAAGLEASNRCHTLDDCKRELDQIGIASDQLPFLQYFNTWRNLPCVHDMVLELAETAAILLDVSSVRLYQDSFFWKRCGDGPTPWHTDARMAPFDTSSLVTLWIPLHDISSRYGSALHFVSKSHQDFALPFWYPFSSSSQRHSSSVDDNRNKEVNPWDNLDARYRHNDIVHYMPLNMGDLTVHSGWTLHCADENQPDRGEKSKRGEDRLALAISYVDARAPVRQNVLLDGDHGDDEDQWSYSDWVQEVPAGQEFEHHLVPIVWPQNN